MGTGPILGGCICGAARYRLAASPLEACTCRCRTCRRAAGAEQVSWATARSADFRWETPPPAAYVSSPGVERTFCATCGTSLTYQNEPETIDVTIASFDDPDAVAPERQTWLSHAVSWNIPDPALPGFGEGGG